MKLRTYQWELDKQRRASTARRVCIQLPTGAGKSVLIREAIGPRTLVLAHAEWLIDQLHALCGGWTLKAGGQWHGWPTIAMLQTAARRSLPEPQIVIVDEAHHTPGATYKELLARWPHARLYGFTATPQRLDGLGLDFDELLCGPSYRDLIEAGWLKPFEVLSIPSGVELAGMRVRAGEYAREDVKQAIRRSHIFGDVVEHYLRHARGGHASFWPSIDTAEHAAEQFRARGVRCQTLHSRLPRVEVGARLAALRTGALDSLATVDMIGEGLDVPGLSAVSLCRPTASLTVYLQQSGRCNRGGLGTAVVLDHVANWQRHGLPDDDREWTLEGRLKRKAAPGELAVWVCEECWAVNQGPECERCGASKPRHLVLLEERAAELEVITRASLDDIHALCGTPAEYVRFAKLHGKRATWAAYQWTQRGKQGGNLWLAAAGEVRPSKREFLAACELCGVHSVLAKESAKMRGLIA